MYMKTVYFCFSCVLLVSYNESLLQEVLMSLLKPVLDFIILRYTESISFTQKLWMFITTYIFWRK